MDRKLAVLSMVVSALALFLAVLTYSRSANTAQSLIQQREQQLIRHFVPLFETIYSDFNVAVPAGPPTTLEQLLDPMFRMVESVSNKGG